MIPRKLANDYKELKYIENLCKSELAVTEQVLVC